MRKLSSPLAPVPRKSAADRPGPYRTRPDGHDLRGLRGAHEKVLNRVPGVHAAVNFATEVATVGFDPATATPAQLIEAVTRAGYGASVRRDSDAQRADDKARKQRDYEALRRDFVVSAILTLPLLAQMVPMLASGGWFDPAHADVIPRGWQLALATPVQFWIGRRFYVSAWHALRGGGANMDVLVVLGTTMAWAFSAVVTVFGLYQHVYFEAGAAVITLVLLGKLLEARAKAGTSAALEACAPAAEIACVARRRRGRRPVGEGRCRRSFVVRRASIPSTASCATAVRASTRAC
jgi:Cu+-exporting ATPase